MKGKAYADIIISESPARSTRLASAELQTYVAKISGARLPIRAEPSDDVPVQIYVGESPLAATQTSRASGEWAPERLSCLAKTTFVSASQSRTKCDFNRS
jgi:hypothetical protein